MDSILDKVMAASTEQELASFNPVEIVAALWRELGSREQDILRRRFGLHGREPETLEEIGRSYNVTRERVRQIENAAIKNIKARPYFSETVKPVQVVVLSSLERHGGLMAEDHLLEYVLQAAQSDPVERQHLLFLLSRLSTARLVREEIADHWPIWRVDFVDWDKARATIAEVIRLLEEVGEPLPEAELLNRFNQTATGQAHQEHFDLADGRLEPIFAHLRASKKIKPNPFREWGLTHWPTVTPRRMGDKIYLVLKKHGEPLHFRDIAERINSTNFDAKQAYAPTVHNELILDERYVLVGRGIYGLKEWGYLPGVVSEVVAAIIEKEGRPLGRDEIVEKVLEQRLVKKGTVYLALSNQERFARDEQGNYYLKG